MWTNGKRLKIVVGHYGSGKTEIAMGMAVSIRRAGYPTALVDLDIVNPFFRSAECGERLREFGVDVYAPDFALTAVDVPSLPASIQSVFDTAERRAIFDVGGDDAGATALGRYHASFERCGYELIYVVNAFRPRSNTPALVLEMMERVAAAARLAPTGIINNANLGDETTPHELEAGYELLREVSKVSGVPILANAGLRAPLEAFSCPGVPKFPVERWLKPEWMER